MRRSSGRVWRVPHRNGSHAPPLRSQRLPPCFDLERSSLPFPAAAQAASLWWTVDSAQSFPRIARSKPGWLRQVHHQSLSTAQSQCGGRRNSFEGLVSERTARHSREYRLVELRGSKCPEWVLEPRLRFAAVEKT